MKNKESTERAGQEGFMAAAEPRKEHRWLQKLLGEWIFEGSATMAKDKPPEKFEGTESVRPLGELWILAEGQGDMPGAGPATTMMTLGYNPQKKRFVGTFIGSMMPHMWVYDGGLDTAGNVLTLDTEGPDMEGKLVKFKDVIEVKNEDHRVLTSRMLGEDGKWLGIVTANYRRRK